MDWMAFQVIWGLSLSVLSIDLSLDCLDRFLFSLVRLALMLGYCGIDPLGLALFTYVVFVFMIMTVDMWFPYLFFPLFCFNVFLPSSLPAINDLPFSSFSYPIFASLTTNCIILYITHYTLSPNHNRRKTLALPPRHSHLSPLPFLGFPPLSISTICST